MPVTVSRLASVPGLALRLRTGSIGVSREVRWAAVSELADPTPFLEGGELLLSTGMHLPAEGPGLADYLDRLVLAGVAAVGLGVGITLDEAPDALVELAVARDLPVLEVPRATPFIAVTRALAEMIAAEQREELAAALRTQRRLVDAALAPEPSHAVLTVLARAVNGWAALLDENGAVREHAGAGALAGVRAVAADVSRLGTRTLHASAAVEVGGASVVVQPVGLAGRVTGFLVAGSPDTLGPARRGIVAGAVSVLSLEPDRARKALETTWATRAVVLRLLLLGRVTDAAAIAGPSSLELPRDDVRVLIAEQAVPRLADLLGTLGQVRAAGVGPFCALLDDRVVALLPDVPELLEAVEAAVTAQPGARAGVSGPGTLAEVPNRAESARQALAAAAHSQRPWLDAGSLGTLRLLGMLHPDLLAGHADAVLAPLAAYGRNHDDLVSSLRSWLEHGGHWDETATALGVHRNTLRYRIHRIEELTGRDLGSMHDRVELWLALQARDLARVQRTTG